MSTAGQFNTKSPTVKRILREAAELSHASSTEYTAAPLETNLFEWHFTIKGPPSTPYADGIYHGRIVLPPSYPLRPPSFRFNTPSGRFEPNREICLSISGHHEESWQPAWGIRTALVAIRAFMESDAKGQVGGVDTSREVRERLARESRAWKCSSCKMANDEIMKEREAAVEQDGGSAASRETEAVPDELKLGYRDELGGSKQQEAPQLPSQPQPQTPARTPASAVAQATPAVMGEFPTNTPRVPSGPTHSRRRHDDATGWLDLAIGGLTIALAYMVIRKLATWL